MLFDAAREMGFDPMSIPGAGAEGNGAFAALAGAILRAAKESEVAEEVGVEKEEMSDAQIDALYGAADHGGDGTPAAVGPGGSTAPLKPQAEPEAAEAAPAAASADDEKW